MPPQRRLIRERFIASATLERFAGMRHQMPTQTRRMTKHLRTQRTIMQLYICWCCIQMRAQMHPQRLLLRETLRAMRTIVRFLSSVRHQMPEKNLLLCETLLAHLALERTFACVDALVAHQCRSCREPFLADAATETALLHVNRSVSAQLNATCERFGTVGALEYLQFTFFVYVSIGRLAVVFFLQFDDDYRAILCGHFHLSYFTHLL